MSEDTDRTDEADPLGTLDGGPDPDSNGAADGSVPGVEGTTDGERDEATNAEEGLSVGSASGDGEVFDDRSGTALDADPTGSGESIVPKRSYCERCEYFSAPPEVSCSHEGTRIVELVDRRHFRVVDCPVVAEREALAAESGRSTRDGDDRER